MGIAICPPVHLSTYPVLIHPSIHPSIYLLISPPTHLLSINFIYLSIHLPNHLPIYPHPLVHSPTYLPIHSFIYLPILSCICPPIYPSIYLPQFIHHLSIIHPCVHPFIHPSAHLFTYPSTSLSIHLALHLPTYQSIHPSISLSLARPPTHSSTYPPNDQSIHPSTTQSMYTSIPQTFTGVRALLSAKVIMPTDQCSLSSPRLHARSHHVDATVGLQQVGWGHGG